MLADEFCPDNFQDVGKALVMQYAINVFLAILDWLFRFKFPYLFIFVLQLLKFQSHAANNIELFWACFFCKPFQNCLS